jgi:phosphoribosylanthranilate isomerase
MTAPTDTGMVIKICGITNEEDARHSIEHGANALGFNFYPKSPRYITPERARQIVSAVKGSYRKVGIFVNPTLEELRHAGETVPLDTLQLHGTVPEIPFGYRVWRAVPADELPKESDPRVEAYLIDTPSDKHGGSGKTFDWSLAADFPHPKKILAGGLNESNVADAIRACSPWGVDACSLLESHPGKKDQEQIRNFLRAILAVSNQEINI